MGVFTKLIAVVYLLIGLYFINFKLKVISLDLLGVVGEWIVFSGGVIVIIHGLIFLIKRTRRGFERV